MGENVVYYIYCMSVSLSADMKNIISVFYRYRPIRKLSISGFIGIGRYEKKLIGHTLSSGDMSRSLRRMSDFENSAPWLVLQWLEFSWEAWFFVERKIVHYNFSLNKISRFPKEFQSLLYQPKNWTVKVTHSPQGVSKQWISKGQLIHLGANAQ